MIEYLYKTSIISVLAFFSALAMGILLMFLVTMSIVVLVTSPIISIFVTREQINELFKEEE